MLEVDRSRGPIRNITASFRDSCSIDESQRNLFKLIYSLEHYDACRCFCSEMGCSPLSMGLRCLQGIELPPWVSKDGQFWMQARRFLFRFLIQETEGSLYATKSIIRFSHIQ
ncbi:hypothetical protein BJX66DRAFT_215245 [Aspergillus keveii]|uniref:Uncharacterized protein n=1 Tax=Aspergillus keveii TaxID=714993 RepID=A0ABR4G4S1_9EURO